MKGAVTNFWISYFGTLPNLANVLMHDCHFKQHFFFKFKN